MNTRLLFSHKTDEWATPQDLFDELNREFDFEIDACATTWNAKCNVFFSPEQDGLCQKWGGSRVFCNPPYSETIKWIKKGYLESRDIGSVFVFLVPARTDTKWFQNYVLHRAEVRFIKGRLKFGGQKNSAPFPSMLVIYRGPEE